MAPDAGQRELTSGQLTLGHTPSRSRPDGCPHRCCTCGCVDTWGGCSFLYSLAGKALHMAHVLLGSAVGPHTHLGVAKARTAAFIALMRPCIHFVWLEITLLSTLFLCVCSCEAELTPGCGLCCCKADGVSVAFTTDQPVFLVRAACL